MSVYSYEVVMNEASLAAAGSLPSTMAGTECAVIDLTETGDMALQLEVTFDPNATDNVVAHVKASAEGRATVAADWDTEDYCEITVPCTANKRVQLTEPIEADPRYMKVQMINEDDTYPAATIIVTKVTSRI